MLYELKVTDWHCDTFFRHIWGRFTHSSVIVCIMPENNYILHVVATKVQLVYVGSREFLSYFSIANKKHFIAYKNYFIAYATMTRSYFTYLVSLS